MIKYLNIAIIAFYVLTAAIVLAEPVFVSAHGTPPTQLVPCGTSTSLYSSPCTPCHLWHLADHIVWYIFFGLAVPILTVVLIWGGFLMMTGGADSIIEGKSSAGNISKGKKMLRSGVIGIIIAAASWLIVRTIINTFSEGKFTATWASISCTERAPGGTPTPTGGGLTCNATGQCVAGGGGISCTTNANCVGQTDKIYACNAKGKCVINLTGGQYNTANCDNKCTTALQCSASTVSPLVTAIVDCVVAGASGINLNVPRPAINQLNGGNHTCKLSLSPPNISCHYGGRNCNGTGNAADFVLSKNARTPANWTSLYGLAIACGASNARCELGRTTVACFGGNPDHVHANASESCGCD